MSREQLHGIIANLRAYLEWQAVAEPTLGIPSAPSELRDEFERRKAARETARMDAARASLADEEPAAPQRPTHDAAEPGRPATPEATGSPDQRTNEAASSPSGQATSESKPWVKYGPRSRKTFGEKDKPEASASGPPAGDDGPPPPDYDGPPLEEPGPPDESRGGDPATPRTPKFPPHGAGAIRQIDASRFGWHDGSFRSPPEPDEGFSPAQKLAILRLYLGDCTRCGLCEGRTEIVFGDGSPNARLMFVGEGPGYNEDKQAKPFVGKAGQLLDKMIDAMGLSREEVYIANVVKCRPPDNRDPAPDEVVACSPFLHKQIAAIEPDVIVTLGSFATHNLLGVDTPISRIRGEWHSFNDIPVMPTWHPAYLLRNESEKRSAWSDLQAVMQRMSGAESGD